MAEKKERQYVSNNAQLMAEWNWERNANFDPSQLTTGSGKKVWWKCVKGHVWQDTVVHRNMARGCPYCSGKRVLVGYNDLRTTNTTLAKEWNYEKNFSLNPENFTANSSKKVWWKCVKGHEWQAKIYHRNNGSGCPICHSERNTSFPEYALLYYIKKYGVEVLHSYKNYGYELDIFMPSLNTAIEYDGYFWHKNKFKDDLEKNSKCEKDGIKLYRIREGLPTLGGNSIDYSIRKDQKDLSQAIGAILGEIIGISIDVNLERDSISIENLRELIEKERSIILLNPIIANEWNYERNGKLKPEHFTPNSSKRVWWKCNKGHEWQATIQNRNKKAGCPYCFGLYATKGENDLKTVNPLLANEWNYDKNNGLRPENVLPNSDKKVWWKCVKGHEWQATVGNRNRGHNCPVCTGRKVLCGYNDLQTINPTLATEWNYEKNNELTPSDVTANSNKKVWWKCDKGHEWQANICDRNKGRRCPYCAGKKVLIGYNDLRTINPVLATEWNYEKNDELTPLDVTANSNKKVWWKCNKGHEWQAMIYNRTRGNSCPQCFSQKRIEESKDKN